MKRQIHKKHFFCSWSGGKDSCLALHRAIRHGGRHRCLLTMLAEDGAKSRSHGLPKSVLEDQARKLEIPIVFKSASWKKYESVFVKALREFRKKEITTGVFGDIDIAAHRKWIRRTCALADITPVQPLWRQTRRQLLDEFIALGFKAVIIALKDDKLDKRLLGRIIDRETITELEKAGVDVSGEAGEYHTVVTDGPLFSAPLSLEINGETNREGYWFLEVASSDKKPGPATG